MEESFEKILKESFILIENNKILWRVDRPRDHFKTDKSYRIYLSKCAGKEAGTVNTRYNGKKYRVVTINGKLIRYHRLIWFLYYGKWPKYQIDHIDGNSLNNSIGNLRDVSQFTNARNCKKSKRNTSGVAGVQFHKSSGKWRAVAIINSQYHYLGLFEKFDDAVNARKSLEKSSKAFGPYHGT